MKALLAFAFVLFAHLHAHSHCHSSQRDEETRRKRTGRLSLETGRTAVGGNGLISLKLSQGDKVGPGFDGKKSAARRIKYTVILGAIHALPECMAWRATCHVPRATLPISTSVGHFFLREKVVDLSPSVRRGGERGTRWGGVFLARKGCRIVAAPVEVRLVSFRRENRGEPPFSSRRVSSRPLLRRFWPAPRRQTSGRGGREGGTLSLFLSFSFAEKLDLKVPRPFSSQSLRNVFCEHGRLEPVRSRSAQDIDLSVRGKTGSAADARRNPRTRGSAFDRERSRRGVSP